MSIYTAQDFRGDTPPPRIIGTEMEYTLPSSHETHPALEWFVKNIGKKYGYDSDTQVLHNGGRIYQDIHAAEYASPESLGPHEATLTEMAGDRIVKDIAGDMFETSTLYRRTGGHAHGNLRSVGYHQNFLTLCYESRYAQERDARVFATYLATRVLWSGAGFVKNRFSMSQKAHDLSENLEDAMPIGSHGKRTRFSEKPMLTWSRGGSCMESHAENWDRLEVRYAEAVHSPWARLMGLATASLVLRLLEHRREFAYNELTDFGLPYPEKYTKVIADDLTRSERFLTFTNKQITALGIQRQFAELSLELAEKVELPEDELWAAQQWLKVCDDLESCNAKDTLETALQLRDRVEWAARLVVIMHKTQVDRVEDVGYDNAPTAAVDIAWDQIFPHEPATNYWQKKQSKFIEDHDQEIDAYTWQAPRYTRAHHRSVLLSQGHRARNGKWDVVNLMSGVSEHLPDPYDFGG